MIKSPGGDHRENPPAENEGSQPPDHGSAHFIMDGKDAGQAPLLIATYTA